MRWNLEGFAIVQLLITDFEENDMTAFHGWSADAPALLAALAADNTREFWLAHRESHAELVQAPMRALAAALEPAALEREAGPLRVFRPQANRRFRPDLPPYRTDTGGVTATAGGSVLGVVLTATTLSASAGHWTFDRGQLRRYRAAVDGPPGLELQELLDGLPDFTMYPGRALTIAPRGWTLRHPRISLLRHRGLQVTRAWELGPWLATSEPLERVRAAWQAAAPLVGWLDEHVGPAVPVVPRPRPVVQEVTAESTSETSLSA